MPCMDYSESETRFVERRNKFLESLACATIRHLEKNGHRLEDAIDPESGLTYFEVVEWWEGHKAKDVERRRREAAELLRKERVKSAMAKLTPEEIAALDLD